VSNRTKAVVVAVAVIAVAVGAFFLLGGRGGPLAILEPDTCPLNGAEPEGDIDVGRPAVAVKIENAPLAYPLSGLEDAEVVYEELVEGGVTRFMAIYHCTDSRKAGSVRSARIVDPALLLPYTKILAYSGSNKPVRDALEEADIVQLDETRAGNGLRRVPREGISSEHTLYANTQALRRKGSRDFGDAPADDIFDFGDRRGKGKRARSISIEFSGSTQITYEFRRGRYLRAQGGEPFMTERGGQLAVDNVVIEVHDVRLSKQIADVTGNPSVEIADETGSGPAVLFRDGRAFEGTWERDAVGDAVRFLTRSGKAMVFKPGTTWIHLVPSDQGEVKGSFTYDVR
jgi:hypothetical protein